MEKKLGLASIVVVAQNHNPSILSPDFLATKKILDSPVSNFAHTPVFSVVEYKDKGLTINVTPDRFGINLFGTITAPAVTEMAHIVISYFDALPETPITALGINFHGELNFKSSEEERDFQSGWLKPNHLSTCLEGLDVQWGSTARFQLPGVDSLVTLKIEPGTKTQAMGFLVNGNFDVKGTKAMNELLKQKPVDLLSFSSKIIGTL